MKKLAVIFWLYLGQYVKTRLSYKTDFIISLLSSLLAAVAGYGFVLVLFTRIPHLQGWSFDEILFLYGFSLLPMGVFNIVSLNLYEFGDTYIIEGRFDRVLLRPLHSLFQVLFENFRLESIQEILLGLGVVAYCFVKLGIPFNLANAVWFPVLVLCGATIYTGVFVIVSSVSFWFEDRIGLAPPIYNMIAFGRYPITIYSVFIQFILNWIIPFAFASFYPTIRYLGRMQFMTECYLVPAVAAVVALVAIMIWNRGVQQYQSTGS